MTASVAVVSPGLLPIPPIIGGSVETVIQKMAEVTGTQFNIDIYGPAHASLPVQQVINNINYYRFPVNDYPKYFQMVRTCLNSKRYHIMQVENRPLFIPKTKAASPNSRFVCSLHSLIHIDEKLIRPGMTLKIFRQCDKVLVYSKFMSRKLAGMFPQVSDKFHYIHLATEPERFRPCWDPSVKRHVKVLKQKHGIPENRKIVLFAGRVIEKKGVHILLTAMEQVLREYPDCCLVILGSGWYGSKRISPYITRLRQQARKIADKIYFTNYIQPGEVPGYFAMADIFVCPSQWDEPFGLVNVEAMASGIPVVASARGGIPEIVTNGVNGFLVNNENNPQSFVGPILTILKNPELARSLGQNGRKTVEKYFNWPRAGRELINFYEGLLS